MQSDHIIRPTANDYFRLYVQTGGGSFPVFAGSPYQSGAGLGNIFKSIARFMFPVLLPTASTFIRSAAKGLEEGRDMKSALRDSIGPTIKEALGSTITQIRNRQSGSGKNRKRRRVKSKKTLYKAKNQKKSKKRKSKSRKRNTSRKRSIHSINF